MSFLTIDMLGLIAPACIAGLLVASTHVPLGREVLRRGIIFMDLAVAQIAGLGAVAASVLLHQDGIIAQIIAFTCAVSAALAFSKLEKKGQAIQEAFIGCAFVLAASIAILLFAGDPHGGEEISNLMAGQILWVSWMHISYVALLYIPIAVLLLLYPKLAQRYFYLLFAICITLSVQMVGVYLVFAALILPALASRNKNIYIGYAVAALATIGGLIASIITDLPSGPVIVCTYAIMATLVRVLFINKNASESEALQL